ncbi:endonuclease [Rubrivirga sp. SAORIC476]|uniref:endonuclease/exonuclease/phosphatase family protein n=1 Tax=Rubrivirga sp. SAORIC476 TaxID=1961794 RepID=UPI000BA9D16F|nr:endonuclease/exonuclease/phosphatase family protein [Rubrivirga sp. SAORIC476]PAP79496.1 endonuclease [Rubrivirga sp. SAORIC476]
MPRLLVLLALLGACASPAPTSGPTASPFEVEAPPVWSADGIRIATFNGEFLFDGEGDEGEATFAWKGDPAAARAHRDAIAAVVRTLDADLVLIPETENLATLQRMADESLADLGYDAVLVDGLDSFTGQDVGLLSRFPVEAEGRTNERATVGVSDARYGVSKNLWARLTLPDGTPVTVIGVHFLARPDDVDRRDRREAQAEVIRQLVQQEIEAGRQVIALGDFNDLDDQVQDRGGYRPITDVLATVKRAGPGPEDDLVNVIGDVPQAERFTSFYDRNGDGQFDAGEFSAIDHVLLSPALYRRVVDVRYVHSHDPRTVSDHFPIVVTLAE